MKPQRKRTLQEQQEIEKKTVRAGWMRSNLTPCAKREETQSDEEEGKPRVPLPDETESVPPPEEMSVDLTDPDF